MNHDAIVDTGQADYKPNNLITSNLNGHKYSYFNPYPHLHQIDIANNHNTQNSLCIARLNIRSLPNHYDELCILPIHQFDIICFSETWLKPNHSDQSIELTFFSDPFRHDRNDPKKACGGGSAIYCKIGLQCTQLPELENTFDDEIDSVWLKVKTKNKTIVLGTIYKPPDANNTRFIDWLEEVLMHASVCQNDVIITGDFNINWHDSYCDKTKLQTVMEHFNLSQIIKGRHTLA